jgi:hypothetical protein
MKNCKEMAVRVEKGEFNDLSLTDKIRLKFHLMMCKGCAKYAKDSKVLHHILCSIGKKIDSPVKITLEEKSRLKSKLESSI